VRAVVDAWVAEVPHPHRREFATRLRNPENHHFAAAFFELYLHALLRRLGYAVTIHPRAGSRGRRPDFLAIAPNGPRLLIEAATVEEGSAVDRAAQSRVNAVFDTLNGAHCPDYFLHVEHSRDLTSPVPGRQLRHQLRSFLATLDYDTVWRAASSHGLGGLPTMKYVHGSFGLEISAIPVSPERRGDPNHRPLGVLGPGEAYSVDDRTPIRNKVRSKAAHYGRLRRPLLIAVNALGRHVEHIDAMQALFGSE
jgi:hypothetical protein